MDIKLHVKYCDGATLPIFISTNTLIGSPFIKYNENKKTLFQKIRVLDKDIDYYFIIKNSLGEDIWMEKTIKECLDKKLLKDEDTIYISKELYSYQIKEYITKIKN
tara:strand:+ start:718 stop:1035 length:318 start_codon:yes stop_codon:yes gene_type:complete